MSFNLNNLNRTLGGGKSGGRKPWWWSLLAMILAGIASLLKQRSRMQPPDAESRSAPAPTRSTRQAPIPSDASADASDDLAALIRSRRSDVIVQSAGTVIKVLPDDADGDRHQRFLVRITSDDVILIAHNIDLAARIPVREGDAIKFKGEFEFNDRGGCMHWTHKDKKRWHEDGWVELNGKRYE